MRKNLTGLLTFFTLFFSSSALFADEYSDTLKMFRDAGESASFFNNSYGYALFPTIGKAGLFIGGAYGEGRVYVGGNHVGDTVMKQATIGFQFGGQGFSQIIFFKDKRAFDEFTSGNFEFSAQAEAVVITAAATAKGSTTGNSATASGGKNNASTVGEYYKGMATFTIIKGGLMYDISLGGQQFDYTAK